MPASFAASARRLFPLRAVPCAGLFLLGATAGAQSPAPGAAAELLPEVRVRAEAETATGPVPGYVARRSATATKTDTPLLETPQSVTVISAEQIRDQAPPNLQEALRYTAGVRHELYGVDNRGDWVSLRGSESTTTFLDGLRLPLTGWYGVVRNEPYAFERIEILRGPSSIVAGAMDPGGVVNLVSKRPLAQAQREVGVRLGNHAHKELQADLTGPLNEDRSLLYRLVAVGRDSGTQVRHADDKRSFLAPSLTWAPRAGHTLTVYAEYQEDRSGNTNAFLPRAGTLEEAPNGPIPSDLFIGEPAWDRYGGTRKRAGYSAAHELGDGWRLRHQVRHDEVAGLQKSMYANWWQGFRDAAGNPDPNGRYLNRTWYIYDDRARITTGELLFEGQAELLGMRHRLLVGLDGLRQQASKASASGAATPLDVYDPVYGSFDEPELGAAPTTRNHIRRLGVLLQDQFKPTEAVAVRLGLRHDKVRNTVVGGQTERDSANSVNLGATYQVLPGWAPYASYSESFDPVSGTDAQGRAFKPKRARQFEVGVKWESPVRRAQATASVYTLREKNRLTSDPDNVGYSVQLGEARVRGFELEGKADVGPWNLLGSYSHTRARASAASWGGNLDPTQQLEGIPEHMASAWAVYRFARFGLPGWQLGAGVRHVGRIGDGTGAVHVPSVTLFDWMTAYETGPWRFALNVNNLTDKDYIATCLARGDCWFGQRRKAVLTASLRF